MTGQQMPEIPADESGAVSSGPRKPESVGEAPGRLAAHERAYGPGQGTMMAGEAKMEARRQAAMPVADIVARLGKIFAKPPEKSVRLTSTNYVFYLGKTVVRQGDPSFLELSAYDTKNSLLGTFSINAGGTVDSSFPALLEEPDWKQMAAEAKKAINDWLGKSDIKREV